MLCIIWYLQVVLRGAMEEESARNLDKFDALAFGGPPLPEHGKWIKETEFEQARSTMPNKLTSVQSQLMDLQLRYAVLEGKYEEAKQTIHRSSLRDRERLCARVMSQLTVLSHHGRFT